jgi:hypothetical protein
MKGVVFNLLEETVTRAFGADTWDHLVETSGVHGAYTSLGNYPDAEIEALVVAAMQALSLDRDQVLRWFGQQAIPVLNELYPAFFDGPSSARAFTAGINTIIHSEVRKLYPDAACPHFRLRDAPDGGLVMDYLSSRNMCALAQGFVEGAAAQFGEQVDFRHVACKTKGDPHCRFEILWTAGVDDGRAEAA